MAMRACAAGENFMDVTDEKKDEMRLKVLEALLTLPFVQFPKAEYHELTPTAGFIE